VAAFRISAKSFGTRTDEVRLVGISAGIPDLLADREMQNLIGGIANHLHGIEGSRPEVSVLGCTTNEYGEGTCCKSAIVNPVDTIDAYGYWWLRIRQPESPAN
jgi:hypothetical protein